MSQKNVEIVRASIAAYRRGDLDAALKDFDPYVAIRPDPNWPENRPSMGYEAAAAARLLLRLQRTRPMVGPERPAFITRHNQLVELVTHWLRGLWQLRGSTAPLTESDLPP